MWNPDGWYFDPKQSIYKPEAYLTAASPEDHRVQICAGETQGKVQKVLILGTGSIGNIAGDELIHRGYDVFASTRRFARNPNTQPPRRFTPEKPSPPPPEALRYQKLSAAMIKHTLQEDREPHFLLCQHLDIDPHCIQPEPNNGFDMLRYENVLGAVEGMDTVLYLAWIRDYDNWKSGNYVNLKNIIVWNNIYRACAEQGVKNLMVASSVHADGFLDLRERRSTGSDEKWSPYRPPKPICGYGHEKNLKEAMAQFWSEQTGMRMICIRFGGTHLGLRPAPVPECGTPDQLEMAKAHREVWFSPTDCGSLLRACIDAPQDSDHFHIVYGVSANDGIQSTENTLGWEPTDSAKQFEERMRI